jgi:hypothetical protein
MFMNQSTQFGRELAREGRRRLLSAEQADTSFTSFGFLATRGFYHSCNVRCSRYRGFARVTI